MRTKVFCYFGLSITISNPCWHGRYVSDLRFPTALSLSCANRDIFAIQDNPGLSTTFSKVYWHGGYVHDFWIITFRGECDISNSGFLSRQPARYRFFNSTHPPVVMPCVQSSVNGARLVPYQLSRITRHASKILGETEHSYLENQMGVDTDGRDNKGAIRKNWATERHSFWVLIYIASTVINLTLNL